MGAALQLVEDTEELPVVLAEVRKLRTRKPYVTHNSGNNEWYTPAAIINVARQVMGGIDLDPASCIEANAVVKAKRFYSVEDNGLAQEWHGRVWLNPPYGRKLITPFITKLVAEWEAGHLSQACCLTNNATETAWGQLLLHHATLVCFLNGRVKFWAPGRTTKAPVQGQMLVYFGPVTSGFEALGTVLQQSRQGGAP